jgi:8-oxo-dGTP diphosphatase
MKKRVPHIFNIRVYGLFINDDREILLADEERFGMQMTKFPGGGLRFGEGTIDCLKREVKEESGQEIEIISHYYTTDFYQQSLFHKTHQLIAIYYLAKFRNSDYKTGEGPGRRKREKVFFRYRKLDEMKAEELSFPVDRLVLGELQRQRSE